MRSSFFKLRNIVLIVLGIIGFLIISIPLGDKGIRFLSYEWPKSQIKMFAISTSKFETSSIDNHENIKIPPHTDLQKMANNKCKFPIEESVPPPPAGFIIDPSMLPVLISLTNNSRKTILEVKFSINVYKHDHSTNYAESSDKSNNYYISDLITLPGEAWAGCYYVAIAKDILDNDRPFIKLHDAVEFIPELRDVVFQ